MQWLIIKPESPEAESADYALLEGKQSRAEFAPGGWGQLKDLSKTRRIILLVPTEDALLSEVDIPVRNQKQLSQAIPYAMEDALVEDIEDLHFVFHREQNTQPVNVAVIQKQRLNNWILALKDKGISPHIVLPDVFSLPVEKNTWNMSCNNMRALIRQSKLSGFVCSREMLPILLSSALEDASAMPTEIISDNCDDLEMERPEEVTWTNTESYAQTCDAALLQALPLNLLKNFGDAQSGGFSKHWKNWKTAASLLGATAVLWAIMTGIQNQRLANRVQQMDTAIEKVFQATFPNARVDSDYRVLHSQMEQKLKSIQPAVKQKKSLPISLLATITPLVKKQKGINISKIRFDNNELHLSVTAPSLATTEALRSAITSNGKISANVRTSDSSANKVSVTLAIKEKQ
jgi:type II secretion system protein L